MNIIRLSDDSTYDIIDNNDNDLKIHVIIVNDKALSPDEKLAIESGMLPSEERLEEISEFVPVSELLKLRELMGNLTEKDFTNHSLYDAVSNLDLWP